MNLEIIDKRSLELGVYEYFKYCNTSPMRGVAVITDKQSIFYSQVLRDDYNTHDDIMIHIENEIHPGFHKSGLDAMYKNHVYMASVGEKLVIYLPDNGEISKSQVQFILQILDSLEKYNKEQKEPPRIEINIQLFDEKNIGETMDVLAMKEIMQSRKTRQIVFEDEKVIGKTLTKEEIRSNLKSYFRFETCKTLEDVLKMIRNGERCCCDSYYREIFLELFPDFPDLFLFLPLRGKELFYQKIESCNYQNVKEKIFLCIRNIFKKLNSYDDVFEFFLSYKSPLQYLSEEEKNQIFPNYEFVFKIFRDIFPYNPEDTKYIDSLLKNISSYDDFSKLICSLGYNKMNLELSEMEQRKLQILGKIDKIKIDNNIASSKDILNNIIDQINELEHLLYDYNCQISEKDFSIIREGENLAIQNEKVERNSHGFLKKFIHRKKMKSYVDEVESSKKRRDTLISQKEELTIKRDEIQEKILLLEKKFKDITHFDFVVKNKSRMEVFYKVENHDFELSLLMKLKQLEKRIVVMQNEISAVLATGIVLDEPEMSLEGNKKL